MLLFFCTAIPSFLNTHSYLFNWLVPTCSVRGSGNNSSSRKPSLTSYPPQRPILTPGRAPITLDKYYHYSEKEFRLKLWTAVSIVTKDRYELVPASNCEDGNYILSVFDMSIHYTVGTI